MDEPKKRILVIEDSSGIRLSLEIALGKAGYAVMFAEDGESGLAMATKEKPDLIILDLFLPVVDGFKVLEQLKIDRDTEKIPIVIFSVLSQKSDQEKGRRLGAIDYIVKSEVSIDEVVRRIGTYLH